jgi:tRNA threonylcarbamoyladenosine biosynthesis protein TsaB
MKIFACDSTALTASVAICEDERLLGLYTQNGGNTHSETLLPLAETMFKALKLSVDDIDIFSCSAGPGSFTGVRIGAATVKGLAFGSSKPCIGVSTLEALALNLVSDEEKIICPVMDARRGQLYTATFLCRGGELERVTPDRAIPYSAFGQETLAYNAEGKKIYLCGDGYELVKKLLPENAAYNTPEMLRYQSAYSVAQTALALFKQGVRTSDGELRPTYLRLPQAERDRLAAENKKEKDEN